MGKGYNNFMSKKAFHPGSYANQKRIQEAEARAEAKRKHDEETLAQYQKEQELFQQKSLVSKESKDKLSLSFMYDAPPGTSQQDLKDEDEGLKVDLKWKREHKQDKTTGQQRERQQDDDDDDEPKIALKWQRSEPKAKKQQQQQSQPDLKRVKKER